MGEPRPLVDSCDRCAFWMGYRNYGYCRRYPPVPELKGGFSGAATHPRTQPKDWCGEFRKMNGATP